MSKRPSTTEYRKDLSCKILEVAWKQFTSKGLKAVRMDDIANELSISKRTLYEIFPNKEELICASFKWNLEKSAKDFASRISEDSDAMDILAEVFKKRLQQSAETNPIIIEEMQSFPMVSELIEQIRIKHREHARMFYIRGQEEGFFRTDVNLKLIGDIHHLLADSLCASKPALAYNSEEMFHTMLMLFVRSVCTEKGIKRFDSMIQHN